MMGVLLSRSRQDKVHTHASLCCKVLLQVLCVQAVSHGTRGPTDTCSHTGMSGESRMWVTPSQAGVLARETCPELSEEVWGAPWETTRSTRAGVWERRCFSQRGKQGRRDKSSTATTSCAAQRWLHVPARRAECCYWEGLCPPAQLRETPCPPGVPTGSGGADREGRALSTARVKAGFWQQQTWSGSEKATKERSVYCTLFFLLSFTMALLQSTRISPECSVETCASPNCRCPQISGTPATIRFLFARSLLMQIFCHT